MQISVRHAPDFRKTVLANLYLNRKALWTSVVLGAVEIVLGALILGWSTTLGTIVILIGAIFLIGLPGLIVGGIYATRWTLLQESEVTLTDEGIERRTATTTTHFTWDMVERIDEVGDLWIFSVNRLNRIGLTKRALTSEQRAEVEAFIAGRAK